MTKESYHTKKHHHYLSHKMKDYQVIACFLDAKNEKKWLAQLGAQLKNFSDSILIREALNRTEKSIPRLRKILWGNTLPKTVSELGNGDNYYFFKPESLDAEIRWTILGLQHYSKEIHAFVQYRDQVERDILLGNYAEANDLLEESVKKIGYSVWYYEMRLTITGYQDKLSDLLSIVTNVNEIKKGERVGIVQLILRDLMLRSQRKMSALEYDNVTFSRYKGTRTDLQNDGYSYFLFRLNYYQHYDIKGLASALLLEGMNSIYDRYTTLINVLRSYYDQKEASRPKVIHFANQLYKLSGDEQLLPFIALTDIGSLPDSYYEKNFISILDSYYTGHYDDTISLCRDYLKCNPSNFETVRIYCRALMFLDKGYQPVCSNTGSPLNAVTFYVFNVLKGYDNEKFLDKLYQVNKNLYGLSIAAGIDNFIKVEQNVKHSDYLWFFSLTHFDPFYAKIYKNDDRSLAYLERGLSFTPDSVAVKYQIRRLKRIVTNDNTVVEYISKVDNAKITYERGEYAEAIDQWQEILKENQSHTPTAQTAVEYIFKSLVKEGVDYRQKAVKFYVNQYMANRSFVSKVDTRQFMKDIKKSRYDGLNTGADLVLFVFLNAYTYPQKQFVLQSYCNYEGVTYPSELIGKFRERDLMKIEQIFRILLKEDILYHHYKLKSTTEVLEEKLKIVNYLKSKFPTNKEYSDIYTELMHELIAYRGMTKLDDSKIYVNEDAVMKYELCDINEIFARFKKQASLARQNKVFLLVGDFTFDTNYGTDDILKSTINYSNNAVSEVATQLFSIIKHAFLRSRFGLGTYLSTRIRHGVFEGELRSGLEKLNLVFSLENKKYVANPYWRNTYNLRPQEREKLFIFLEQFTKGVDKLISEFKDTVIQIHEDEHDEKQGGFNYEIPTDTICNKMLELEVGCDDPKVFCRKVIDYLWEITEQRLEHVRSKVKNELTTDFSKLLQTLERETNDFSTYPQLQQDLNTRVNKAREDITAELNKVEKWFYRQKTKFEDFRLESHIDLSIDAIHKYMPEVVYKFKVNPDKDNTLIRAEYSASMFDMLTIFLNNMFQYSRRENQRRFEIDTWVDDNRIQHIHLENDLPENANEDQLNKIFQERISDVALLQKEGGSGLVKAMNIIKYDFGDDKNTFSIIAKDGKCMIDISFNLKVMSA